MAQDISPSKQATPAAEVTPMSPPKSLSWTAVRKLPKKDLDAKKQAVTASTPDKLYSCFHDDPELQDRVRSFFETGDPEELPLPASLGNKMRKEVHHHAGALGLGHESKGLGEERHIVLTKGKDDESTAVYCIRGYFRVEGPSVEWIAKEMEVHVPQHCLKQREKRDGVAHHITILNRGELSTLFEERKKMILEKYKEVVGDLTQELQDNPAQALEGVVRKVAPPTWQVIGVGKASVAMSAEEQLENLTISKGKGQANSKDAEVVTDGNSNTAYFVVLKWEEGNALREALGFTPKDFHVTLGFSDTDIHNVRKDESTLVTL